MAKIIELEKRIKNIDFRTKWLETRANNIRGEYNSLFSKNEENLANKLLKDSKIDIGKMQKEHDKNEKLKEYLFQENVKNYLINLPDEEKLLFLNKVVPGLGISICGRTLNGFMYPTSCESCPSRRCFRRCYRRYFRLRLICLNFDLKHCYYCKQLWQQ